MPDPTLTEVAKQVGDTQSSMNIMWVLLTGFLVMFMQAGFALVETGLVRAKNVAHTMGMNMFVYTIGILGFWTVGFALQMGGVGPPATLGAGDGARRWTSPLARIGCQERRPRVDLGHR